MERVSENAAQGQDGVTLTGPQSADRTDKLAH